MHKKVTALAGVIVSAFLFSAIPAAAQTTDADTGLPKCSRSVTDKCIQKQAASSTKSTSHKSTSHTSHKGKSHHTTTTRKTTTTPAATTTTTTTTDTTPQGM